MGSFFDKSAESEKTEISEQTINESLKIYKEIRSDIEMMRIKKLEEQEMISIKYFEDLKQRVKNIIDNDVKNDLDNKFYNFLQTRPVDKSFTYVLPNEIGIAIDNLYGSDEIVMFCKKYFEEKGFSATRFHAVSYYTFKVISKV